jgi:hypothetical protein
LENFDPLPLVSLNQSVSLEAPHFLRRLRCDICFDRNPSLIQLKWEVWTTLSHFSVITVPCSLRKIHHSAFRSCIFLFFGIYVVSNVFSDCDLLGSIFLPRSVLLEVYERIIHYFTPDNPGCWMTNDALFLANDRKLMEYQVSLQPFCVNRNITILFTKVSCANILGECRKFRPLRAIAQSGTCRRTSANLFRQWTAFVVTIHNSERNDWCSAREATGNNLFKSALM